MTLCVILDIHSYVFFVLVIFANDQTNYVNIDLFFRKCLNMLVMGLRPSIVILSSIPKTVLPCVIFLNLPFVLCVSSVLLVFTYQVIIYQLV